MGNQQLIASLTSNLCTEVDITDKQVTFIDGMFQALTIFQRHNFQLYKVKLTENDRIFALRIIHALSDKESVRLIERMQKDLIHIKHPNLVEYVCVAVEEEKPNIQFMVIEEYLNQKSISLRHLQERIGNNTLLMQFFAEKTYMWRLII